MDQVMYDKTLAVLYDAHGELIDMFGKPRGNRLSRLISIILFIDEMSSTSRDCLVHDADRIELKVISLEHNDLNDEQVEEVSEQLDKIKRGLRDVESELGRELIMIDESCGMTYLMISILIEVVISLINVIEIEVERLT